MRSKILNFSQDYLIRFLYTGSKFGWLTVFSIYVAYLYGFGSDESILVFIPFQIILIADFSLSVMASITKRRPPIYIALMFSALSILVTIYFYQELLLRQFDLLSLAVMLVLMFAFSLSVVVVNSVDSIGRSEGSVVPIKITAILWCGFFQILTFPLAFYFYNVSLVYVFVVFIFYGFLHFHRFLTYEPYVVGRGFYTKIVFFSIGVMLVYFGTRLDLTYSSADAYVRDLDYFEKYFALLMFPINILLNVFHSKVIDVRGVVLYVAFYSVVMLGLALYYYGASDFVFLCVLYFSKFCLSLYMFYGNYVDSHDGVKTYGSVALLCVCILLKFFLVEDARYSSFISFIMVAGVFSLFVINDTSKILMKRGL